MNRVEQIRAAVWTLRQVVPGFWFRTPPNQAAADVVAALKALEDIVGHAEPVPDPASELERVGGVQWCVTHHGLNDETGENHIITERDADGDVLDVHEDCCDSAELEPDGTFRPCDLRDLVALPKAAG